MSDDPPSIMYLLTLLSRLCLIVLLIMVVGPYLLIGLAYVICFVLRLFGQMS